MSFSPDKPLFDVIYYQLEDGSYPVEEFIVAQDVKMQAKIFRTIMLLEQFGNSLREPYSKYLRDDIFELRIKTGSNISRVLYFFFEGRRVILTNGFVKKADRTPQAELNTAIERKARYFAEQESHNE